MEGYERFFGLNEAPFSLAPNPRFLFESASHAEVLRQVAYALERREPLVVITGEIGAGKTLLCRTVLQRLERKTFLSVIDDPLLDRDDLLRLLLQDFGVISKDRSRQSAASRHDLIETLQAFLRSLAPIEAHAVVIIDEAQHLQPDVLEQIRLLSNVQDEAGTMLQIILVGQTGLDPLLSRPELRQLQQRVSRRLRLDPLDPQEVRQYVEHRLATARGGQASSRGPGAAELERALAGTPWASPYVEFTPDAMLAIATLSGGLPRVINLVCDRALEAAHATQVRTIDRPLINAAARALGLAEPSPGAAAERVVVEAPAPEPMREVDDDVAVPFEAFEPPVSPPRRGHYLALAGALGAAAVAVLLGVRASRTPRAVTASSQVTGPSAPAAPSASPEPVHVASAPAEPVSGVVPVVSAVPTGQAMPAAATPTLAATATASTTASTSNSTTASTTADERVEIVVASFRTESRATTVMAGVAALGLPVRQRTSDGWQQVVAGPFASRAEARDVQQRLGQGGFAGAQIVARRVDPPPAPTGSSGATAK